MVGRDVIGMIVGLETGRGEVGARDVGLAFGLTFGDDVTSDSFSGGNVLTGTFVGINVIMGDKVGTLPLGMAVGLTFKGAPVGYDLNTVGAYVRTVGCVVLVMDGSCVGEELGYTKLLEELLLLFLLLFFDRLLLE